MSRKKHFPEESVSARMYPSPMNVHLQPLWCQVRNQVMGDQQAIQRYKEQIKACKEGITFMQTRVLANLDALDSLEDVN